MNTSENIRMMIYASLFAALTAAGAYIAIPIGPVPIVLQNMFVLMGAILLGPVWGLASILLYLFMGACGFPVFSGGTGGFGRLFGPTGGYLLGYIPAVAAAGIITSKINKKTGGILAAMLIGSLIVYAAGVPWLKFTTGMAWEKSFALGMYPFIPGDVIKIAAGVFAVKKLGSIMHKSSTTP